MSPFQIALNKIDVKLNEVTPDHSQELKDFEEEITEYFSEKDFEEFEQSENAFVWKNNGEAITPEHQNINY